MRPNDKRPCLRAVLICAALLATSTDAHAEAPLFGYAAIACDLDDPHDDSTKTDFIDEVAGWTTANQICITGERAVLIDRLQRSAAAFTPVFMIEPVFFNRSRNRLVPNPDAETLWAFTRDAISASGIDPHALIFYLVDEPAHFGLPRADVEAAISVIESSYPGARTLVIEALGAVHAAEIPRNATYWGLNGYAMPDPLADRAYRLTLETGLEALGPDQHLAVIMDAVHTPFHTRLGISPNDMGQVARAYEAMVRATPKVGLVLGYTWAGGIDGAWETGLRDMPPDVIDTHMAIAKRLTAP